MIEILILCLDQALTYVPLALGSYISISRMKLPDLSLESAFTSGGIAAYTMLQFHLLIPAKCLMPCVIMASFCGGALVGLVSSTLTSYARFPHLLSSIVTIGLFHGINLLVLGTCNVSFNGLPNPMAVDYVSERISMLLIIGVVYGFFILLSRSQLGITHVIYGRNKEFFNYYGISERYVFMSGLIISNGLVGMGGFLCAFTHGFVDTGMGVGIPLLALTILIMGKILIDNYSPVLVPVVGTYLYFIIQQVLLHAGFDLKFFTTVQALLVLIILVVYYRRIGNRTIDHLGV